MWRYMQQVAAVASRKVCVPEKSALVVALGRVFLFWLAVLQCCAVVLSVWYLWSMLPHYTTTTCMPGLVWDTAQNPQVHPVVTSTVLWHSVSCVHFCECWNMILHPSCHVWLDWYWITCLHWDSVLLRVLLHMNQVLLNWWVCMSGCRELGPAISTVPADRIRPIELRDFTEAARRARPSVNRQQLGVFEQWTREFGTNV